LDLFGFIFIFCLCFYFIGKYWDIFFALELVDDMMKIMAIINKINGFGFKIFFLIF